MRKRNAVIVAGATWLGGFVGAVGGEIGEAVSQKLFGDADAQITLTEKQDQLEKDFITKNEADGADCKEIISASTGVRELSTFLVISCVNVDGDISVASRAATLEIEDRDNDLFPISGLLGGATIGALIGAKIASDDERQEAIRLNIDRLTTGARAR